MFSFVVDYDDSVEFYIGKYHFSGEILGDCAVFNSGIDIRALHAEILLYLEEADFDVAHHFLKPAICDIPIKHIVVQKGLLAVVDCSCMIFHIMYSGLDPFSSATLKIDVPTFIDYIAAERSLLGIKEPFVYRAPKYVL